MHFLAGAGEGHCHKNPIVTIIVRIYPLSFYGASAINIYGGGAITVYPLRMIPPCPLGVFTGVSSRHRL